MAASASERRSCIWNAFASALRTAPPPKGAALRVQGAGCRVQGSGCVVPGAGFVVLGSGCRVPHAWLRVER